MSLYDKKSNNNLNISSESIINDAYQLVDSLPLDNLSEERRDMIANYIEMNLRENISKCNNENFNYTGIENDLTLKAMAGLDENGHPSFNSEQLGYIMEAEGGVAQALSSVDKTGRATFNTGEMANVVKEQKKKRNYYPLIKIEENGKPLLSENNMSAISEIRDRGYDTSSFDNEIVNDRLSNSSEIDYEISNLKLACLKKEIEDIKETLESLSFDKDSQKIIVDYLNSRLEDTPFEKCGCEDPYLKIVMSLDNENHPSFNTSQIEEILSIRNEEICNIISALDEDGHALFDVEQMETIVHEFNMGKDISELTQHEESVNSVRDNEFDMELD